jgi:NADH-ubiquinone oxidoreductase chain 2
MLFISIISIIVAVALPAVKISPLLFTRITSIILVFSGVLSFNSLYAQSIGSGVGIYSGLFQVTFLSQSIETFIYFMAALILVPWAYNTSFSTEGRESASAQILDKAGPSLRSEPSTTSSPNLELKLVNNFVSPRVSEYSLIILFTTLGASLLISSADLVSMYLSIELQSFAVYILATLYRDSEAATSAGLKYFLLGGLSSCFILLGSGLIYAFTGLTNFESIYSLMSVTGGNSTSQGILLGLVIIVAGFLFKIAAAPFHNWAPDVYDDVPTMVTTWLTVMPKISIVIFLLEIQSGTGLSIESLSLQLPEVIQSASSLLGLNVFKNLLLLSSLLSLIIGTVVGLAQPKIKRLLAYSTISHVGFLLLALAVNTEQSIESLIFYLVQYSLTNFNAFLLLLAFGYILHSVTLAKNNSTSSPSGEATALAGAVIDIKYITQLKGQFYSNPLLSLSLAICLFSMAGIPPLMGFFAKQQVLYSASHSGYYFISLVAILVSVISASYYLKIIKVMHFDAASAASALPAGEEATSASHLPLNKANASPSLAQGEKVNVELSNSHTFIISSLTLTILLFILKPSIILNSTHLLALSIFTN